MKRIGSNDKNEMYAAPTIMGSPRLPLSIVSHPTSMPDQRAFFAMQCIERWGLVAGTPDGEDTAGRSKLRKMSAAEVVQDACEVARIAYEEFSKRGWLIAVPSLDTLADDMKEEIKKNDY